MASALGAHWTAGIVIPAHNEEQVIARLLAGLLDGQLQFQIVVVCNGCTDGTAAAARAFGDRVMVVESPIPSKMQALRQGDALISAFPRLYVDADVELDHVSVGRLSDAVSNGEHLAAGPLRILPMSGVSRFVRTYYRAWEQLPAVKDGLWGRGVIALSRTGHLRTAQLPDVMSDDLAMSLLFATNERLVLKNAQVVIHPPRNLRSLLARRERSVTGNTALDRAAISRHESRTHLSDVFNLVWSSPRNLPGALSLLVVAFAARAISTWTRWRRPGATWSRDESSREVANVKTQERESPIQTNPRSSNYRSSRLPVSVVCVFNDPTVRGHCLDRSLHDHSEQALDLDYITVDNTGNQFRSAGAALNHAARQARNPYVVFVHQDVYLHSIVALERAAAAMNNRPDVGLVGAVGIDSQSNMVGRIRDRVVLSGLPVTHLTDVDSVDEVLFMIGRDRVLATPLSEAPDLAWHAYGVEYCLRVRALGLQVAVADIPLTHNSLTINLARLDVAHRAVATIYPDLLPVNTTCGRVTMTERRADRFPPLGAARRTARWLQDSMTLIRAKRALPTGMLLGDLRRDIDVLLEPESQTPLVLINLEDEYGFGSAPGALHIQRRGRPLEIWILPLERALAMARTGPERSTVIAGLSIVAARQAIRELGPSILIGYHQSTGIWVLSGKMAASPPAKLIESSRRTAGDFLRRRSSVTLDDTMPMARPEPSDE